MTSWFRWYISWENDKKSKNRRKFKNRQSPWFMGRESWFGSVLFPLLPFCEKFCVLCKVFEAKATTCQKVSSKPLRVKSGKRTDPNQDSLPINQGLWRFLNFLRFLDFLSFSQKISVEVDPEVQTFRREKQNKSWRRNNLTLEFDDYSFVFLKVV